MIQPFGVRDHIEKMTTADEAGVHYGVELSKTNKSKCPVCHSHIQKGHL
jgi:hypothetical protein